MKVYNVCSEGDVRYGNTTWRILSKPIELDEPPTKKMMSSLLKVEDIFQKKNQEDPSIRRLVLPYFHFSFF